MMTKENLDLKSDIATRVVLGKAITDLGLKNEKICTVAADSESRFGDFVKKAPDRAINVGIAEQNAVSISAGLAFCGKIVFVSTYATFISMRACEQIRTDVAFQNLNVKVVGTNSGFSPGWEGFTHQALEDIGIMRAIPNMTVIVPADGEETYNLVHQIADYEGAVYLRVRGKKDDPHVKNKKKPIIGKADELKSGEDITIIACGRMVYEAVEAAEILSEKNISTRVLNMHTIKPIDKEAIITAAQNSRGIITMEEHNTIGGLGSAVADVLCEKGIGIPFRKIGVNDSFGIPGKTHDIFRHFGLTSENAVKIAEEILG